MPALRRAAGRRAAAAGDAPGATAIAGRARLGKRTKQLVKRLTPSDIAVIDHRDLDRVSGEDLIACGVRAVLNQAASSSGSYPNMGPLLLVQAGIHLVDELDADLFEVLSDGDAIEVRGGEVLRGGKVVARGTVRDPAGVLAANERHRAQIGDALEAFARNTVEHMVVEKELLGGRLELPRFRTDFRDRPALIVVRGVDHKRDLRALRPYIRDVKPVLVGVDGGANAILEEGFRPDMVVGDMDSATEETLRSGAELVVHGYPDGRAPGRSRLEELALPHKVVPAPGTSQDIAMLIASEKGASLIVSVGSQLNLVEFLDKSRRGMSSTFLVRLRLGEKLVDAKGVSRLYRPRPGLAPLALLAATGIVAFAIVVLVTPGLREVADLLRLKLELLLGGGS
ncbi:MAG TPA: putative cytokinetic ring protein SteA [Solirubrobacteraceae bacterium]|nr:putative cytokinetic ring protein SteA [Solirubrobacteraceae bacterium]